MAGLDLMAVKRVEVIVRTWDATEGRRGDVLERSFDGHDSLNEQGLGVLHVHVQETHEGDSLFSQKQNTAGIRQFRLIVFRR
jgi:hypothetical protein